MPGPLGAPVSLRAVRWCCLLFLVLGLATAPAARAAENEVIDDEEIVESQPDPADQKVLEQLQINALKPWTGDLDGMLERRRVRVLVTYNRIFYFADKFRERGLTYEMIKALEDEFNKSHKLKKEKKLHFIFVPVGRDELIPYLLAGKGDLIAGNLTITPDRESLVDFSVPIVEGVHEIVITAPGEAPLTDIEDLSGREVVVRRSSSYYESLMTLNAHFTAEGKPPVQITLANEALEDDAIAEMVNAGLYPAMIMDRYKAKLWEQVFTEMTVYPDIAVRRDGKLAWAFRKDSPQFAEMVNGFIAKNKFGGSLVNTLIKRYLKSTKFVVNATSTSERQKFEQVVQFFQAYASEYSFDYLLLIAQGYQESRLDQGAKNPSGATGIMQVLPSTAAGDPINIKDVSKAENNIHAGVKYLRFMVDEYFDDPALSVLDRHLFAFASYNAGPNRIARLRKKAAEVGLDPNRWFNNVEVLVSAEIGRETVDYVANIFKYYLAYKRIEEQQQKRDEAIEKVKQQ